MFLIRYTQVSFYQVRLLLIAFSFFCSETSFVFDWLHTLL